ncbi:hypothetical protein M8J75_013131 [Diaphorina citri]|nr:hypothetical protein M8J75_013131 [Diaphorina citri]
MVPSDLLEHCRLCLVKECVSVNIFENDSEIRQLYYKIVATLPVEISRQDDKLPKKICTNCNSKVDELYQFWSLTANSQKTLLRWLHEAEETTTLTKIKCEFDADMPVSRTGSSSIRMKVEPEDNSSDDDRGANNENFDDYRDDSDVPEDNDLLPTNMVNVSIKDGEGEAVDRKPKKLSMKKKSSSGEGSSGLNLLNNESASSPSSQVQYEEDKDYDDGEDKPLLLTCVECNEDFINVNDFVSHLRGHDSTSHVCDICLEAFPSSDDRDLHFLSHLTSDGLYQCNECEFVGKRLTHLKTHKKIHEKVYGVYCDVCGRGFHQNNEVTLHKIKEHNAFPFQCEICHKIFTNKSTMWSHKKAHKPEDQIPWECEHCHKVYPNKRSYKRHKQVHLGVKHECEVCHKKLSSKQHLKLHILTHSKEKPLVCTVCNKGFKRKDYLNEHMRIHTGDRPYKCDICDKGFTQKQALNTHVLSHTKQKPYQCLICADRFITRTLVRYHLKSHHGLNAKQVDQPQFSYFDDNV